LIDNKNFFVTDILRSTATTAAAAAPTTAAAATATASAASTQRKVSSLRSSYCHIPQLYAKNQKRAFE
jgi:hypothetical protein